MTDNAEETKVEAQTQTKRKSKITKSISRKLQTTTYENVSVHVGYEEEVEWSNIQERAKKSEGITALLIRDFNKTLDSVWNDINRDKNAEIMSENTVQTSTEEEIPQKKIDLTQCDGL